MVGLRANDGAYFLSYLPRKMSELQVLSAPDAGDRTPNQGYLNWRSPHFMNTWSG